MNEEVANLPTTLNQQKEEQKLFRFLNGHDDIYGAQRSQLLMMVVLPSVEIACSYLEQEEAQREVLGQSKEEPDGLAMFIKGGPVATSNAQLTSTIQCGACGKSGHNTDKCKTMVGYPAWHAKAKPIIQPPQRTKGRGNNSFNQQRWNKGRQGNGARVAANVQGQVYPDNRSVTSSSTAITTHYLERLLRLIPNGSKGGDTDDEINGHYAGMVSCYFVDSVKNDEWIIDSGASDHMTGMISVLKTMEVCQNNHRINSPTGETS